MWANGIGGNGKLKRKPELEAETESGKLKTETGNGLETLNCTVVPLNIPSGGRLLARDRQASLQVAQSVESFVQTMYINSHTPVGNPEHLDSSSVVPSGSFLSGNEAPSLRIIIMIHLHVAK